MIFDTWGDKFTELTGRTGPSIYLPMLAAEYGGWRINGAGPDRLYGPPNGTSTASWPGHAEQLGYPVGNIPIPYDATNGTVSAGDVIRSQLSPTGYYNTN